MSGDLHVAFHYLGCVEVRDGATWVPGRVGALIEALAERVGTLTVVAYEPSGGGLEDRTDYAVRSPNVRTCSLGPKGSAADALRRRRRVRRIVGERRGDWDGVIVKLPNRRVPPVLTATAGIPTVALIVGHTPSVVATTSWPLWRKAFVGAYALWVERVYRRIVRRSVATIVNSEALRARYGGTSLPLSSRRAAFRHQASDRLASSAELMISGRITAEKGVFEALDAFTALRQGRLPHARLHVIGDGPDHDALIARARERGLAEAVVDHGWVPVGPRLFDLYAAMDVLLLPSYAEGLPYAVYEAMAHSVLVVCTPVGGLAAAFEDGRHVLFVDVGRPDAIVDAVLRLDADAPLRRRLIAAAYELAEPLHLDSIVEALIDPLRRGRRGGPPARP